MKNNINRNNYLNIIIIINSLILKKIKKEIIHVGNQFKTMNFE